MWPDVLFIAHVKVSVSAFTLGRICSYALFLSCHSKDEVIIYSCIYPRHTDQAYSPASPPNSRHKQNEMQVYATFQQSWNPVEDGNNYFDRLFQMISDSWYDHWKAMFTNTFKLLNTCIVTARLWFQIVSMLLSVSWTRMIPWDMSAWYLMSDNFFLLKIAVMSHFFVHKHTTSS